MDQVTRHDHVNLSLMMSNVGSNALLGCQVSYNIIIYLREELHVDVCSIQGTMTGFI